MKAIFTLLAGLLAQVALAGSGPRAAHSAHPAPQPALEFIENKGQWEGPVRYSAALPGGSQLFAERDGLRLALLADGALASSAQPSDSTHHRPPANRVLRGHTFDLRFAGASPAAHLLADGLTAEHRNYFRGSDPSHWASDVRSYHELRYAGLWPGVEARFYENDQERLEYDFTVAPGASPAAIGLRHPGAAATLDAQGNLLLATSVGTVRQLAPLAYQVDAAGARRPVTCHYRLAPDSTVRFALGRYDATRALIIDPTLVFATYTGSTATNWGCTATYDAQGNLYSGGQVFGLGYPVSLGAFQTTFGGTIDMGIIKYDITKSGPAARVWATYIGGNQSDYPQSMVVSSQGELLVMGSTFSPNFPVTATAVQHNIGSSSSGSGCDIVLCRLSAAGNALKASTYLGGSGSDGIMPEFSSSSQPQLSHNFGDAYRGDILIDAADNVYVASNTSSTNFPGVAGFQKTYRGGTSDGVVCKLKGDFSSILWSGYLGGGAADAAYSLQLEPTTGDVYVAGGTLSADLPATSGALNPNWSGDVDGYVARIAASGSSLVRVSYLGTSSYDQAFAVQLGTDGGVYVLGQTLGNWPVTPGLYTNAGGRQFIHKLDPNLTTTQLATVFGSGRAVVDITPTAFLVDRCDRVFVCGWGGGANQSGSTYGYLGANFGTSTKGLPTTAYAVQQTTDGSDFYLAQFSAGLKSLGYGSFFGGYYDTPYWGEHVDGGTSRFDPRGVVYQAVCTCGAGASFPVPPGANYYANVSGAGSNCNNAAFVLNFQADIADVGPAQTVCANNATRLEGSPNGGVWTGPGVSGSVATGFFFTPPALGTYSLTYTVASGACSSTAAHQVTAVTAPVVGITTPLPSAYCVSDGTPPPATTLLVGTPAGGKFSGPGVTPWSAGSNQYFNPSLVTGVAEIVYTYTQGCTAQVSRRVEVVRPAAGPYQSVCASTLPFPLVGTPAGGTWSGPGVSGSVATGYVFTPSAATTGSNVLTYSLQAADKSCTATSVRTIAVAPGGPVLTPLPSPLCVNTTTRYLLAASPVGGYWYGAGVSYSAGSYYFTPSTTGVGTFTLTYSLGGSGLCTYQNTMTVVVSTTLVASMPADTLLCPGTTQAFRLRGASPAGGVWAGPGVSGSAATGFFFTPPAGFAGSVALSYTVSNNGCTSVATRRVGVSPVPALQPAWTPVTCPEDRQAPLVVRFTDNSGSPNTRWDFGDGTPAATGAVVEHTYQNTGHYQPSVSLRYLSALCETTAPLSAIDVKKEIIPNVITPNGDGENQAFRLPPSCAPRLQLFSRWGQQVFEAAAYQNDWDATGHPAGTYYYLLTYPDGHRVKGWLDVLK